MQVFQQATILLETGFKGAKPLQGNPSPYRERGLVNNLDIGNPG
jgi:hypothetical protein